MKRVHHLVAIGAVGLLAASSAFGVNAIDVLAGSAIEGNFGLEVTLDGTNTDAYVQSDHPTDEKTFTARFWIDPNNLADQAGNEHIRIMHFATAGCCQQVIIFLSKSAGTCNFRINAWARNDAGTFQQAAGKSLTSGAAPVAKQVEVTWTAATAPGANDGSLFVTVDGTSNGRSDLDNDTLEVDTVRAGAFVGGNQSAIVGSWDFDSYESFR